MSFASLEKQGFLEDSRDLSNREPISVTQLTYNQIPKAVKSFNKAFVGNPQHHYLDDTPDKPKGKWPEIAQDIIMYMSSALWIYRGNNVVNAVDGGSSGIYA